VANGEATEKERKAKEFENAILNDKDGMKDVLQKLSKVLNKIGASGKSENNIRIAIYNIILTQFKVLYDAMEANKALKLHFPADMNTDNTKLTLGTGLAQGQWGNEYEVEHTMMIILLKGLYKFMSKQFPKRVTLNCIGNQNKFCNGGSTLTVMDINNWHIWSANVKNWNCWKPSLDNKHKVVPTKAGENNCDECGEGKNGWDGQAIAIGKDAMSTCNENAKPPSFQGWFGIVTTPLEATSVRNIENSSIYNGGRSRKTAHRFWDR